MPSGAHNASLRGLVVIPAAAPSIDNGAVHVRLENVTRADAAATVVAEVVVRNVSHKSGAGTEVAFELTPPSSVVLDPRDRHVLRAWVEAESADTRATLYSDESHPVSAGALGHQSHRITVSFPRRP